MRIFLPILFLFTFLNCFSQETLEKSSSNSPGIKEFKAQERKDTTDFSLAYKLLMEEVEKNPKNTELRYFLGYTIDRIHSNDAKGMVALNLAMTMRASEQFERINKLEPLYEGELFLLDPYAKLTSIWGSLAQSYLIRKDIDSAKWAFSEGRRRGGFIEPFLEYNRQLLNSCASNAILITQGDMLTFPLEYLQTMDGYRKDITIVDASMINAAWYPKYLKSERQLHMSFSDVAFDTLSYLKWESQTVSIVNKKDPSRRFSWELRPTYYDEYILMGDRILLDILQQNFYQRPVYFSEPSDSSVNLFLTTYLKNEGLVTRVVEEVFEFEEKSPGFSKKLTRYSIDNIDPQDILKSPDAIKLLNSFRWLYYKSIYDLANNGHSKEARDLYKLMSTKFDKTKLPFISAEIEKGYMDLYRYLEEN